MFLNPRRADAAQQPGACPSMHVPQTTPALAALCQSARGANEREGCPVLPAQARRLFPELGEPVCGSFRFYVLMIDDETGVLRHASASLKGRRTRGEAERVPLHPIRVIPAREVSGDRRVSSFFQYFAGPGSARNARPSRSLAVVSSLKYVLCAERATRARNGRPSRSRLPCFVLRAFCSAC